VIKFFTIAACYNQTMLELVNDNLNVSLHNNFDSPLHNLVSKYELMLFISAAQIIGEICGEASHNDAI